MVKYFFSSYIVTILGLVGAFLWGEHVHAGTGWTCMFIASVLAILEVSLSFDNAVVNAMKLENMSEKWRHRFITWGILIAVFGMRFVFPIAVVAIFANLDDNAEIRNVNFTNVIYDFTGIKAENVKVAALAVSSAKNVKINNVTVTGTLNTNYTGSITTQNNAVLEADETTVESGFTATITINVQN